MSRTFLCTKVSNRCLWGYGIRFDLVCATSKVLSIFVWQRNDPTGAEKDWDSYDSTTQSRKHKPEKAFGLFGRGFTGPTDWEAKCFSLVRAWREANSISIDWRHLGVQVGNSAYKRDRTAHKVHLLCARHAWRRRRFARRAEANWIRCHLSFQSDTWKSTSSISDEIFLQERNQRREKLRCRSLIRLALDLMATSFRIELLSLLEKQEREKVTSERTGSNWKGIRHRTDLEDTYESQDCFSCAFLFTRTLLAKKQ